MLGLGDGSVSETAIDGEAPGDVAGEGGCGSDLISSLIACRVPKREWGCYQSLCLERKYNS